MKTKKSIVSKVAHNLTKWFRYWDCQVRTDDEKGNVAVIHAMLSDAAVKEIEFKERWRKEFGRKAMFFEEFEKELDELLEAKRQETLNDNVSEDVDE